MSLLITGGFGFIGNNIIDHLLTNWNFPNIVIIDKISYCSLIRDEILRNPKITFFKQDTSNKEEIEKIFQMFNFDIIIHLAAESSVTRSFDYFSEYVNSNILGSFNILELSKKYGAKKILFMSTDEVYGESSFQNSADESSPLFPTTPYSVTKASSDMIASCFYRCFELPVTIIRSSNIYGKYQYPEKIIPRFIIQAMKNKPCTIEGTGNNKRTFIYIEDFLDFFDYLLKSNDIKGQIFNITSNNEFSNLQIAEKVNNIFNRPLNSITFVKDRLLNDPCYKIKSNKITFWKSKTPFEEGLRKTADWYLENFQKYWSEEQIKSLL
jgi:dTDP-glucose 4,6-dehydratase